MYRRGQNIAKKCNQLVSKNLDHHLIPKSEIRLIPLKLCGNCTLITVNLEKKTYFFTPC